MTTRWQITTWRVRARNLLSRASALRTGLQSFPSQSFHSTCTRYSNTKPDYEDFYRYTTGRWLWNEEEQLRKRYRRFDVDELKRIAVTSVGAQSCTSMVKLTEDECSKAFRLVMNNGSAAIARIPFANFGPVHRSIASEVATMDFARSVLNVPVPKVLSWSSVSDNSVGSQYILMEEPIGAPLNEWKDMKKFENLDMSDKIQIIHDLVAIQAKSLSVSFSRYGNLYFTADSFPGCERIEILEDIPQRDEVERRFVMGPVVKSDFWKKERATMAIFSDNLNEYLDANAHREVEWINHHAKSNKGQIRLGSGVFGSLSDAQDNPASHIQLYQKFLKISSHTLPTRWELMTSNIWCWDLYGPSIFVHNNKITGLTNWQGAWAGPLFLEARRPHLVSYNGPLLLEEPENFDYIDDPEEKARIRKQIASSVLLSIYEAEMKKACPEVHQIYQIPHWKLRRQTVATASRTWDDDIIPFRQCLIRMERYWDELNTGIPCPITFSKEEMDEHFSDGEGWNEAADFWDSLDGLVARDGWTWPDTYENALELFAEIRQDLLQYLELTDEEREEVELQLSWAVKEKSSK